MGYTDEIDRKIENMKNELLNDLTATRNTNAVFAPAIKTIEKCPSCGTTNLIHAGGCIECICGWSACS